MQCEPVANAFILIKCFWDPHADTDLSAVLGDNTLNWLSWEPGIATRTSPRKEPAYAGTA